MAAGLDVDPARIGVASTGVIGVQLERDQIVGGVEQAASEPSLNLSSNFLDVAIQVPAGGTTPDDAVEIARLFKAAGADLIDVSSGQTTRDAQPVYGRMYQTPFADRIRNEARIPTIAVGAISEADHVDSIIAAGRADLCAIARPHLADAAWTLREAARLGVRDVNWPRQYLAAKRQLETNLERAAAQASGGKA